MRITSSEVAMGGGSALQKSDTRNESIRVWVGQNRPDFEGTQRAVPVTRIDTATISAAARATMAAGMAAGMAAVETAGASSEEAAPFELSPADRMKIALVEMMLESLTGKKVKIKLLEMPGKAAASGVPATRGQGGGGAPPARAGFGVEYDLRETHYESQSLDFAAKGVVKTADGQEISFSLELKMEREYFSEENVHVRLGDAVKVDPLVLNLDGAEVELTNARFEFDLNADGTVERVPFVGSGSGMLALDVNGDGVINDGSELFGPTTGNGFAELSALDGDGNGWIDEGDSVFGRLLLWTKDGSGNDSLRTVGEAGIGAICLGNVRATFDIKDPGNNTLGVVQQTGVYLRESGTPGVVQQVDLVT